jgi:hypothetical protein
MTPLETIVGFLAAGFIASGLGLLWSGRQKAKRSEAAYYRVLGGRR